MDKLVQHIKMDMPGIPKQGLYCLRAKTLNEVKNNFTMRRVHCVRCGKVINEGEDAVRHKHFTGFYCSFRCLALEMGISEIATVTNELVEEDREASGYGWDEE